MSATGLDVFDKTLQTTHIWLDKLMEEIGADRRTAWHVLGAVLRTIRDRVPLETAVHLGAQLPLLVRGTYYDQWDSPGRMDEKSGQLQPHLWLVRRRRGLHDLDVAVHRHRAAWSGAELRDGAADRAGHDGGPTQADRVARGLRGRYGRQSHRPRTAPGDLLI